MAKVKSDKYYRRIFGLFRPLFLLVGKFAFHCRTKRSVKYDEPVLILCNHTTDLDFLLVSKLIRNHFYFVCSRHIVGYKWFGKRFFKLFNPITVFKGSKKTKEVMDVLGRIKRGNSVLIFPEGMRSHDGRTLFIAPSTAKLAKVANCKLVTVRIKGGFFKQPRWNKGINGGKIIGAEIVNEYTKEYLKTAPNEEILNHIREDLYVNAYAEQEKAMIPYKLRHGAEGIERYFGVCPACGAVDSIRVNGNNITCSCGLDATYSEYGYLSGEKMPFTKLTEWYDYQNGVYERLMERPGELFRDREVGLYETDFARDGEASATGDIICYADKFNICGEDYFFSQIDGTDVLRGGSMLLISRGEKHLQVYKKDACLAKYSHVFNLYKSGKN